MSDSGEEVPTSEQGPGPAVSARVAKLVQDIYDEFQNIIDQFGPDAVQSLVPLVENVLENLDNALGESEDNGELVELKEQYEKERQRRKEAEERYFQLEDANGIEIRQLKEKVASMTAASQTATSKVQQQDEQISHLLDEIDKMKKEAADLKQRHIDTIEAMKEQHQIKFAELRRSGSFESDKVPGYVRRKKGQQQNDGSVEEEEYSDEYEDVDLLEPGLQNILIENEELLSEKNELERELREMEAKMNELNRKISEMENMLREARETNKLSLEAVNARLVEKTRELNVVEIENERLKASLACAEEKLQSAEVSSQSQHSELEHMQARTNKLLREKARLQAEVGALNAKISEMENMSREARETNKHSKLEHMKTGNSKLTKEKAEVGALSTCRRYFNRRLCLLLGIGLGVGLALSPKLLYPRLAIPTPMPSLPLAMDATYIWALKQDAEIGL